LAVKAAPLIAMPFESETTPTMLTAVRGVPVIGFVTKAIAGAD
jgi:hypothetical protein